MVEVFAVSLQKRYVASRCSWAYVIRAFFWVTIVVLPYLIAFASWGFWKTEGWYREQPTVKFMHKVIMSVEGEDSSTPLYYSTMQEYNDMIGYDKVRMPVLTSSTVDSNADGVTDHFHMSITMPLRLNETVHRLSLLLFFHLELKNRVRLEMEGLGVVMKASPLPGAEYHVNGDLRFKQLNPVPSRGTRSLYSDSLLPRAGVRSVEDLAFPTILAKYFQRNDTMELHHPNSFWVPGRQDTFKVHLNLRIPTQDISYIPDASETLKHAWIQYISVLCIVYVVLDAVRYFVYSQQVVPTLTRLDTVPPTKQHHF